jgi:dTMP kinase
VTAGDPVATGGRTGSGAGLFVVFEGGDGVGKSTQVDLVVAWLAEQGHDVLRTHEPGGSPMGADIRRLLLSTSEHPPSPRTEALLYAAERAEHVHAVVRPALARGAVVVSDRYLDSSVAYQGVGRELGAQRIEDLSRWATDDLRPDLVVLLDLGPEPALRRSSDPADRLEAEPLAFHESVRQAFLALARRDPGRYLVLDADRPAAQVHDDVRAAVLPLLARTAGPGEGS